MRAYLMLWDGNDTSFDEAATSLQESLMQSRSLATQLGGRKFAIAWLNTPALNWGAEALWRSLISAE